ncbi:MAG: alpha/beta hydrolase [Actinomycetes bacterium]
MSPNLHVVDLGSGPAFVLLHAFPCDGSMWRPQAEALAIAGWRVLVPDLPGFGASPLLESAPSLDAVAGALLHMLDERGIDRCVVGGISLGGYLTMTIARLRPSLIAGVALCDTKATADSDAARENRERLARLCEESPDDTARILEQAVLPGLLGDTSRQERPEVVETVRGWLESASASTVAWYQRAMAGRPDSQEALSGLDVPALIVWGVEDALSPRAEQDLMLACLRGARLVAVEGAGHLANVERPDVVAGALVGFAAGARGRPSS